MRNLLLRISVLAFSVLFSSLSFGSSSPQASKPPLTFRFDEKCEADHLREPLRANLKGVTGIFIPGYLQEFYTSGSVSVVKSRLKKAPDPHALRNFSQAMEKVQRILADERRPAAQRLIQIRKATEGLAKESLYGKELAAFFHKHGDKIKTAESLPENFHYIFSPSHLSVEEATEKYICPQLKLIAEARGREQLLALGHSMGGAKGALLAEKCPEIFQKKTAEGKPQLLGVVQVQPAMGGSHSPDSQFNNEVKAAWREFSKEYKRKNGPLTDDALKAAEALTAWQMKNYRPGLESLGSVAASARAERLRAALAKDPTLASRIFCVSSEANKIEPNHRPIMKFYEFLRKSKPELATKLYGASAAGDGLVPLQSQCGQGVATNHLHVTDLDHLSSFFSSPVSEVLPLHRMCREKLYGVVIEETLKRVGSWNYSRGLGEADELPSQSTPGASAQ